MANQHRNNGNDNAQDDGNDNAGGGGNRGNNRNQNQRQRQETDLASDPSLFWRFIKTSFGALANDMGKRGYDIGAVKFSLDLIERTLGPDLTATLINFTSAAVQEPDWLKRKIRDFGLPEQINGLIDEFIDDLFEGLRMAYRDTKDGGLSKLTPTGAAKALDEAQRKFAERLDQKTFPELMQLLEPAAQAVLTQRIATFCEDPTNRRRFEQARLKINSPRTLVVLQRLPLGDWPGYFDQLFGQVAAPAAKSGMAALVDKAVGFVTGTLNKLTEPMSDAEKADHDTRLQAKRDKIAARRAARNNKDW